MGLGSLFGFDCCDVAGFVGGFCGFFFLVPDAFALAVTMEMRTFYPNNETNPSVFHLHMTLSIFVIPFLNVLFLSFTPLLFVSILTFCCGKNITKDFILHHSGCVPIPH